MNETTKSTIKALLQGDLAAWQGLPVGASIGNFISDFYHTDPGSNIGRLSGHWLDYHDFEAAEKLPDVRVWSQDGSVLRIDLDTPTIQDSPAQLERLGPPAMKRLPPSGYRYDEEDELVEYFYAERGLALHVTDPSLPGGSGEPRIVRVRAFRPMSIAAYDRDLGGQQPKLVRLPRR